MKHLAAALIAGLTLSLVPAVSHAATAAAGDPDYHRPTVGECRNYDMAELFQQSSTSPTVDCAGRHTAKVLSVVTLPKRYTWATITMPEVNEILYRKCYPAWDAALGGSMRLRDLTTYTSGWYVPTKAEKRKGARWIRCDLIRYQGNKLATLPTDIVPMLPSPPLPDDLARCLVGKNFIWTTCNKRHQFRATGTFVMKTKKYPSRKKFIKAGTKRCRNLVSSEDYRFSWPFDDRWKTGDHVVVCYSKTKH
ncbi:MAG: septum formation family protein [Nocardioides sp.]|uniref:septum formation family protein n=1 Tax=Nocardioides sp. TaxID=35761 RepID=UPI0039E65770